MEHELQKDNSQPPISIEQSRENQLPELSDSKPSIRYFRKVVWLDDTQSCQVQNKRRYALDKISFSREKMGKNHDLYNFLKAQRTVRKLRFKEIENLRQILPKLRRSQKCLNRILTITPPHGLNQPLPGQIAKHTKTLPPSSLTFCIGSNYIKSFSEYIFHRFRALQTLNFNFHWLISGSSIDESFMEQVVKQLMPPIGNYLTNLKNIDLTCGQMSIESVEFLAGEIGKLRRLQSLSLNLSACKNMKDRGVEALAVHIEKLKMLQSLELQFSSRFEVTDDGVIAVANQLSGNLKTLRHLKLRFEKCKYLSDKGIEALAREIGNNLPLLETLRLDVSSCKSISDQTLKAFSEEIILNLHQLKTLELNFSICQKITDVGVKALALSIGTNLSSLEVLNISFQWDTKIAEAGIQLFVTQLGNLTRLRTLKLNLQQCRNITNKSVHDLAVQIGKNLKSLEVLDLNFYYLQNLTQEALSDLTTAIASLTTLKYLELNFSFCEKMEDQGVDILATQIVTHLKSLQTLKLLFISCPDLTTNCLKTLHQQIRPNLKALHTLVLSFQGCPKIDKVGKGYLAQLKELNFKIL